MPSRRSLSGALALRLRRLRPRGRGMPLFDGRPALRPGRVEVGNPTPLAGSCCSLDAARRSSGFAAGNVAAAFRTSSVSSVFKEPQHHGVCHRPRRHRSSQRLKARVPGGNSGDRIFPAYPVDTQFDRSAGEDGQGASSRRHGRSSRKEERDAETERSPSAQLGAGECGYGSHQIGSLRCQVCD